MGLTGLMLLAVLAAAQPAQAQSRRLALVMGSSSYTGWPALESCRTSVSGLSGSLRRAGYEVSERLNPSNAQMGAAITEFSEAIKRAGDAVAVSYVCGYATALDSRLFLLPTSATLTRETDALSQGIVGRLFINAVTQSGARGGLILLDAVALPGQTTALPLANLVDPAVLSGKGYAAVQTLGQAPAGMTELAAAVAAAVGSSGSGSGGSAAIPNDWRAVIKQLRQKLPNSAQRSVVMVEPSDAGSTTAAVPTTAAAAAGAQSNAQPGSAAPLGPADARRVQLALQRLGYYAGKVDGVVGADTVAAIRRFQHELRAEKTGQLSAAQTQRLLKDSP